MWEKVEAGCSQVVVIARETGLKRHIFQREEFNTVSSKAAKSSFHTETEEGYWRMFGNALYRLPKAELGKKQGADLSLIGDDLWR